MRKIIRHITAIILLASFPLTIVGITVNIHHCNMSGSTIATLYSSTKCEADSKPEESSCCNNDNPEQSKIVCNDIPFEKPEANKTYNNPDCCEDFHIENVITDNFLFNPKLSIAPQDFTLAPIQTDNETTIANFTEKQIRLYTPPISSPRNKLIKSLLRDHKTSDEFPIA